MFHVNLPGCILGNSPQMVVQSFYKSSSNDAVKVQLSELPSERIDGDGEASHSQVASGEFVFGTMTHRIHGTGIFTYIYHTNQPFM